MERKGDLCHLKRKKKKARSFWLRAFYLVRLAGIEPTTPWFVAKYSIQLSYSRVALHCSTAFLVGRVGLEPTTKGL
jgi:hypothetical protein